MTTVIDSIYWDSVLSHAAYGDENPPLSLTASAAAALEANALSTAFTGKFNVLDISTTSSPNYSGFAATVVQEKATNQVTIAFRGTEKSLLDWTSDAIGVTTGVAGNQIVDMYNYLARIFALPSSVVPQYSYNSQTGAVSQSGYADGLGLIPSTARVDFTGHSLGGHLAMACSRLSPIALGGYTPPAESSDAAVKALWQQDRAGTQEGQNFTSEYLAAA